MVKEFSRIIADYKKREYFTSAAFCVFDAAGIIYVCGSDESTPMGVFDLASLSKLFTATLVLKKVDDGDIALDNKISAFLSAPSELKNVKTAFDGISIRELLTHTSGLIAWYPFYASNKDFFHTLDDITSLPLSKQEMVYSDLNFILLGKIIEKIYGMDLKTALDEHIRRPFDITHLSYAPLNDEMLSLCVTSSFDNSIEENMCKERRLEFSGFRKHDTPVIGEANDGNCFYAFNGVSGHAGIFSDLDGVSRLGRFYLNTDREIFLKAQENQGHDRGLGFQLGEIYPEGCGHTGFTGTSLYISKKNGIGAVLLTNRLTCMRGITPPDLTGLRKKLNETALKVFGKKELRP